MGGLERRFWRQIPEPQQQNAVKSGIASTDVGGPQTRRKGEPDLGQPGKVDPRTGKAPCESTPNSLVETLVEN